MESYKYYLDKAFSYAKKNTTCRKVAVGSLFLASDGREHLTCNRCESGGFNCQKEGYCFKAKESGIYESTEATRHLCKAVHSEVHMANWLMEQDDFDMIDKGILFVTRYPCLNCAKTILDLRIPHVVYGGRQEISDEVRQIFDNAGIKYEWVKECDYEGDEYHPLQWWTTTFYDRAYDIVKDRKYPIIIPSYNRPNAPALTKGFLSKMTDEYNYPIYVFVRDSQYDSYVKGMGSNKFVTIISLPDKLMLGAGAARRQSLKWLYNQGYEGAFSFDDDLLDIGYTHKGFTGKGDLKSKAVANTDISKVLAMWQISMEHAIKEFDVMISGVMPIGFSWKAEYSWEEQSMLHYRGLPSQAVCLNVQGLVDNELIYGDNDVVGHEDIALTIDILNDDKSICVFPFLYHSAPPMSIENWGFSSMKERFQAKQDIMKEVYGHLDWVGFREKRDLAQVVVNWVRYRKQKGITKYIYNIWNNGELLNSNK